MRVIFIPTGWTILLCFIMWLIFHLLAALICLKMPDRTFSNQSFFFKTYGFEKDGHFYNKVFCVSKWKHLLPDGGMVFKKHGFRKKRLEDFSKETLSRFLIESARGELTHWLSILPFWIFGFIAPPQVIFYMLIYSLLANMPCIIAQRYNRPRVQRLLNKMQKNNTADHLRYR